MVWCSRGCLSEERIRQRYNWAQAIPHSQLESRMHAGWRACSQSPSGREGVYLQQGGFPSRGEYCLCCHIQGCLCHRLIHLQSLQLSKAPSKSPAKRLCGTGLTHWFLAQKEKGMMSSPMTTGISAMRNQSPFLQIGEMKPVLTYIVPATQFLQNSC